jgi:hypothetical protein
MFYLGVDYECEKEALPEQLTFMFACNEFLNILNDDHLKHLSLKAAIMCPIVVKGVVRTLYSLCDG